MLQPLGTSLSSYLRNGTKLASFEMKARHGVWITQEPFNILFIKRL